MFVFQFALVQYGTYVAFSWDIMEPITCTMTLGDVIIGYYFWLITGKPYNLTDVRTNFYDRLLKKTIKRENIDYEQYQNLKAARAAIMERLTHL